MWFDRVFPFSATKNETEQKQVRLTNNSVHWVVPGCFGCVP